MWYNGFEVKKNMAKNARINVAIMPSTKARLLALCEEKDLSQGDVIDDALKNFFEHLDRSHSAPDLVLDRLNALTLSIMQLQERFQALEERIEAWDRS